MSGGMGRAWMLVRAAVVGASAMAGVVVTASAAQAWTTNGPLNFAAAGAFRDSRVTINAPNSTVAVNCSSNSVTGNLKASQASGTALATATPAIGSCSIAGVVYVITCSAANLNAVSYLGGVTTGNISNMSCTATRSSCTITATGSVNPGTYANPTSSTAGKLSFAVNAEALKSTWTSGCNGSVFNGASPPSGGSPTTIQQLNGGVPQANVVYNVTSPSSFLSQPTITNP